MLKILFLYSSLNGFLLSTLRSLYKSNKFFSIDLVYWDKNITSGNKFKDIKNFEFINFHKRSELDLKKLKTFVYKLEPQIIYISGWMDKDYIKALNYYRKFNNNHKTICGFDDQWFGTTRQFIGSIFFKIFLKKYFDKAWVSGSPQYHYAKKFGFKSKHIIFNLLSADSDLFSVKTTLNKRIVYVGRLEPEKGPDLLIEAYRKLSENERKALPLTMIGDGTLLSEIQKNLPKEVKILSYLKPDDLIQELSKGGIGCVPSRFEPWGVVLHEYALLGYPIISSSICGANSEFLIENYNGYTFKPNDIEAIYKTLKKIISLDEKSLLKFSKASLFLGNRINSEIASQSLLSIIK